MPPPLLVRRLAAGGHGVVARRQLLESGLSPRVVDGMVAKGWLVPVHRGVYAVGHARLTTRGIWTAAVLACGPAALLSHRSAAALHGIGADSSTVTDVLAARSGRRHERVLIHRTRSIHPGDRTVRDGIPVTSVARTLLDLADVVDSRRLERALEEADRLRLLDARQLGRVLERANGRRQRKRLASLLAAVRPAPHTRSELERRFIDVIRAAGLPRPLVNATVMGYEVDMLWPRRG